MFRLTIQTDSASFRDADGTPTHEACSTEVARILHAVAERVEEGIWIGDYMDVNGNIVGEWEMMP